MLDLSLDLLKANSLDSAHTLILAPCLKGALDQAISVTVKTFHKYLLQNLTRMVMLTTTWEVRGGDPLTIYSFHPCGQPHFPNPAALAN